MHRRAHGLALCLAALMLALASAGAALAQPSPPRFSGPYAGGEARLPFCTQQDKDKAIAAHETEIKAWETHIEALNAYLKAYGKSDLPEAKRADDDLIFSKASLAHAREDLERAKARPVVDCSTVKGVLPPPPKVLPNPWASRKGLCDPKAVAEYLAALRAARDIADRNWNEVYRYQNALAQLEYVIRTDPKSRFAPFKDQVDKAMKDSGPLKREVTDELADLDAEIARVEREEPIKCPGVTEQPGGRPAPQPTGTPPKPPTDGPGDGSPPWKPHRPQVSPISAPVIPAFCDEFARNAFLGDLNNLILAAGTNVDRANGYLIELNAEFAKANADKAPVAVIIAIKHEIDAYAAVSAEQRAAYDRLEATYREARTRPLDKSCPKSAALTPPPAPPTDGPTPKEAPKPAADGPKDGPKVGCRCLDTTPIAVGSNSRVGSGARTRDKAVSTAIGLVGGLLGGGGNGGGGGGSDGPQLVTCRIDDKEMTAFDDPATGTSLQVGAKRSGDRVVVFANVAKSPDSGSFQAAYLQDDEGGRQAPRDVGICGLWGEWKLTVSWTRTTYVNDQVVSRESGGWSRSGAFHIPGTLSTAAAPDGLWKRLGFSNASHGARKIALTYDAPKAKLAGGPLGVMIHVARPGQDPVTTVPFALKMSEGPKGFTFEKAAFCSCSGMQASFSDVPIAETEADPIDYRTGDEDKTRRKIPGLPKPPAKPDAAPKSVPPGDSAKPAETPKGQP